MTWGRLRPPIAGRPADQATLLTRDSGPANHWAWVVRLLCVASLCVHVAQASTLGGPAAGSLMDSTGAWAAKQRAALVHPQRSVGRPPREYRLVRITPDSARVGDIVRIVTIPQAPPASLAVVTFDGRSAEAWLSNGNLVARVPAGLEAGAHVAVNVEIGKALVRSTGKLYVLPFPLRIVGITPNSATHGDTVRIALRPPFPFPSGGTWDVHFNSVPVPVLVADPNKLEIVVVIPKEVPAGRPVIVLRVGAQRSEPFAGLTVIPGHGGLSAWMIWIVALLAAGVAYSVASLRARQRRSRAAPVAGSGTAEPPSPEDSATYAVPEVPADLVSACLNRECVLYVGAGLSAAAGFPTWVPFVGGLLEWTAQERLLDPALVDTLRRALQQGEAGPVADNIVNALRGRERLLDEYLRKVFVVPKSSPPASHALIRKIGFSAVLTPNFDTLLETALETPEPKVLTSADSTQLIEALSKRAFFVLKLYGVLGREGTVLVAPEQYLDAMARNAPFGQFMENLFFSRTLLFVGASLEGIEDYLKGVAFREHRGKPHYALVNARGTAWQAKAASLARRYGIQVLPYTATEGFPEVTSFLAALSERVNAGRSTAKQRLDSGGQIPGRSVLKRVRLENIGPFRSLDLELDAHLNILLGDNGLGKSMILKAISVGLCGKDAEAYAGRLIRSGETEAKIILETERSQYLTQLLRRDGDAELTVRPGRPLEAEGWLAVGFPPLRSVSWRRPGEPKPQGKSIPTAKDLLPLVMGDPDPRMDNLKQWLVDLDYMIARESTQQSQPNRYRSLRDEFFNIIDKMTPGVRVRFKGVDPATKQVTVITDDGEVPIESVSQGTTSLISWIGVLLQRIYEVYGDERDPLDRYSLVLIDEVDAHMHPEWQQMLVHALGETFPNAQFVATTHSPLIVAGLPTGQVVRLRRNADAQVEQVPIDPSTTMGRADQVLTSALFDLRTTVDPITQEHVAEYQKLLGMNRRDAQQEERYRELETILQFRIPMTAETPPERRAQELVRAILRVQAGAEKLPEPEQALMDRAAALLSAVSASRGERK